MTWRIILLVAAFLCIVVATCAVAWFLGRRRFQFSLRTLMLGVTLVAVALSAWYSWRHWTTAKVTWIDPSSPTAARLVPQATIVEEAGIFKATFTAENRGIGYLVGVGEKARKQTSGSYRHSVRSQQQQADFEVSERAELEVQLAAMQAADVPMSGQIVIHGLVENAQGQPVSDAIVDVPGHYVNCFMTRLDGTFTLPIRLPSGSNYCLEIRQHAESGDGWTKRIRTPTFAIRDGNRELFLSIRVK